MIVKVHFRDMTRRDVPDVLAIENVSSAEPLTEEQLLAATRPRTTVSMVCEHGGRVVGFMIYDLLRRSIRLEMLAVHPEFRRQRVGAQMLAKLAGKLAAHRRNRVVVTVSERNATAHHFLKAGGFFATGVVRGGGERGDDAYRFVMSISELTEALR